MSDRREELHISFWLGSAEMASPRSIERDTVHTFHHGEQISEDDYFDLLDATEEASDYVFRETHAVVVDNFESYTRTVDEVTGILKDAPPNPYLLRHQSHELRVSLFNWLLSVRAFLDHSKTRLTRTYDRESEEVKRFTKVCAKEFDEYFAYRFMYKLRDYSQHCGFPPVELSMKNREGETDPTFDLYMDREVLLADFDHWTAHVKPDLEQQELHFPVEPMMREMVASIDRIDDELKQIERPRFLECQSLIREARESASQSPGTPLVAAQVEGTVPRRLLEMRLHDLPSWLDSQATFPPEKPKAVPSWKHAKIDYDTSVEDATARWARDTAIELVKARTFGPDDPSVRFLPLVVDNVLARMVEGGEIRFRDTERIADPLIHLCMALSTLVRIAVGGWSDATDPDMPTPGDHTGRIDLPTLIESLRLVGEKSEKIW